MRDAVGKERLVLDLSCRKTGDGYRVVTDRWQRETQERVEEPLLERLSGYCDEFLIHAVDVEGQANGIEEPLAALLGKACPIPLTYAGGVHNFADLQKLKTLGRDKIDVTIGSALDLFGGSMKLEEVMAFCEAGR